MRRLTKKKALTLVKELDAFPKVPESYVESTATGGTGTMEQQCSFQIYVHVRCNTHSHTSFSVPDSILSHGYTCLPGILCVQRHMDEV